MVWFLGERWGFWFRGVFLGEWYVSCWWVLWYMSTCAELCFRLRGRGFLMIGFFMLWVYGCCPRLGWCCVGGCFCSGISLSVEIGVI